MSKDTKKYIGNVVGIKVQNILYFIYIFELNVIGKDGRKDVRGHWKGPKKITFEAMRVAKKTSWMLKMLMF
jgi:hypothetical protein